MTLSNQINYPTSTIGPFVPITGENNNESAEWLRSGLSICWLSLVLMHPSPALGEVPISGCPAPRFTEADRIYAQRLPTLSWLRVPSAEAYEVTIVARVPEGPVIDTYSARISALQATVPRLDSHRPTKLSLDVRAVCGGRPSPSAHLTVLILPSALAGPPTPRRAVRVERPYLAPGAIQVPDPGAARSVAR